MASKDAQKNARPPKPDAHGPGCYLNAPCCSACGVVAVLRSPRRRPRRARWRRGSWEYMRLRELLALGLLGGASTVTTFSPRRCISAMSLSSLLRSSSWSRWPSDRAASSRAGRSSAGTFSQVALVTIEAPRRSCQRRAVMWLAWVKSWLTTASGGGRPSASTWPVSRADASSAEGTTTGWYPAARQTSSDGTLPGPREELHRHQVGGHNHGLPGEEAHTAAVRPARGHEALGLEPCLEARPHLFEDVVDLLVRVVHQGEAEGVDRGLVDLAHADRR